MDRKTYEELQIFNQGMRDMGQGLGALGQAAESYRYQNMMHKAGADMLEVIRTKGVQGLDAQTLAGIAQKHNMGADGISMTLALMKQSGAALKANQEYLTEVEQTRTTHNQGNLYEAQTGKAVAETQTENELRPEKVRSEHMLGNQRESAVRLNNANATQVNALTPVKVAEGNSRIAVNNSAVGLNRARTEDVKAKPGSKAAADDAKRVQAYFQSIGVKPNDMASSSKDGSVTFTQRMLSPAQAQDVFAAAGKQGIAITGRGDYDKQGQLTGFYITSAVYDPATAARQRLITERPKAGAKPAAAPRPAAGKPVGNVSSRVGGTAKRQPGESLADYLKRTGAY